MSNVMNKQKIMERLNLNCDAELMRIDLNAILEEELSKPVDEMDPELVRELMDLMEVEAPTQEQQEECWAGIQKGMKKGGHRGVFRAVRKSLVAAAALVGVFFVTFGAAQAFQWSFLLKLLAPVAETFGIYSANNFETEPLVQISEAHGFIETMYEQLTYDTLEAMPQQIAGLDIVPEWLPEGFEFIQSTVYEDPDMMRATILYGRGEATLSLAITMFVDSQDISGYLCERSETEPRNETISGLEVTFYSNVDSNRLSATWINENVCYLAHGEISEEELYRFVEELICKP